MARLQALTVVVHGATAPSREALAAVERAVAATAVEVELCEVWLNAGAANPLSLIDRHVRAARHPDVMVIACAANGRLAPFATALDAFASRGGLVIADNLGGARARCALLTHEQFLDALSGVARGDRHDAWPLTACGAWATSRESYLHAGGLDPSLWMLGEADDLARRALARGVAVEFVDDDCAPDAYAFDGATRRYLAIRNTIVSAALHGDPGHRGRAVALATARALHDGWRASGVDPGALRFGGDWAKQRRWDRLSATPGLREGDALWPRDVDAAMRPFVAADDALATIVARAREIPHHADIAAALPAAAPARPTPAMAAEPVVSVIVVNWNGRAHLTPLYASLRASDFPRHRLELLCVDNGSTDGSQALLAAEFPEVRVVALPENRGFTGGNIAGVAVARGDVLMFLNNDMRVEPDTIARLVAAMDEAHPCTGACVLSWDGERIDFLRGTASWEARGFQEHFGAPRGTVPTLDTDATFFPNGGAFAITRDLYTRAGGFDAAFFAYYDDLDLGWGLRNAGGNVRVVRDAIVYHRHGATSSAQPRGQKRFLMERNALWTMVKRYGDDTLARALAPALLLAVRRFVQDAVFTTTRDTAGVPGPISMTRAPLETMAALGEAVRGLGGVIATRRLVDAHRTAGDERVVSRLGRTFEALSSRTGYRAVQEALMEVFGLGPVLRGRSRVLLLTHDPLQSNMSGPGVRVFELGRALAAAGASVTVASPFESDLRDPALAIARYRAGDDASVAELAALHDVIVIQGFALEQYPSLATLPAALVADLYCPFTIEHLEMRSASLRESPGVEARAQFVAESASALQAQNRQLAIADFFLCASERQRDFWLGALQTAGRLTLDTYGEDASLRSLIDVVPFGLPDAPPPPKRQQVIKGRIPGIGRDDFVLLWAGSILDWQDPLLLIRAVARLSKTHPDVKLVFMGTRHPNPAVPPMRAVPACRELAESLGVLDRHVFFNEWVAYAERHEWLLEADLGVTTHRDHLETHFSFRTRMLDYLWAGLPIVATAGDVFAELIEGRALGLTVAPGDEDALVSALGRMRDDQGLRDRSRAAVRAAATTMTWNTVAAPLVRFCANPRQAADRRPATEAFHRRLRSQFRLTKWLKRTAVRMGMSDARIDQLKQTALVRQAMILRNRRAYAKARRG